MKQHTVVITRPDGEEFAERVSAAGFATIIAPVFSLEPVTGTVRPSEDLSAFKWIIFTSRNGVKYLAQSIRVLPSSLKIAVIGARTAAAVTEAFGKPVDFCGDGESSEKFSTQFLTQYQNGEKVLLAVGCERRGVIEASLTQANVPVDTREVYRQVERPIAPAIEEQLTSVVAAAQLWTFFSPSAFRHAQTAFSQWKKPEPQCKIFSIGKVTSQAVQEAGFSVTGEALEQSENGMIEALCRWRDQSVGSGEK